MHVVHAGVPACFVMTGRGAPMPLASQRPWLWALGTWQQADWHSVSRLNTAVLPHYRVSAV